MRKSRKFCRRLFYTIGILCCTISIIILLFAGPKEYGDNNLKIQMMEALIQSDINKGECRIPHLPIDNPEIMKFYKPSEKLQCGNSLDDWVTCEKSICFVKPEVTSSHGEVVCSYTDIIRKTDYKVKFGKTTKTVEPYVLQESDFVKVVCSAQNGQRWYGLAAGIRDTVRRSKEFSTDYTPFNVLMFGFDSLSRNAFIRKLPKTYEYLVNEMSSIVLNGYNIVGDGTPQALIPILTGSTELELPETRKRMRNSVTVNSYPLIWKNFEKYGYITSFNEDIPNYGTFTYRMNGFNKQPTDHYLRTFYLEVDNILSKAKPFCISNQPGHKVMLDYTKNFMAKYSDKPRFVFSFHGELSHDSINDIGAADDDVRDWLRQLKAKRLLDDTIFIFMSDHGNRFADVRSTLQGKQEERLPFFSFAFPESFRTRFATKLNIFKENSNRLTTPFDIHETLMDILKIQFLQPIEGKRNFYQGVTTEDQHDITRKTAKHGISLFEAIPANRSCASAYIEPHWCACLNWKHLNETKNSIMIRKIAQSVLNTINNFTSQYRHLCEPLDLRQVNWAMKLMPHSELLKFKQNKDIDGFIADLSSEMRINEEFYQIQLMSKPGNGLYEASVSHNLETFEMKTSLTQISRINKYGSQANCIYERDPELRKFCYCRA